MTEYEGVVKYDLDFSPGPLPDWADVRGLDHWFRKCRAYDLIGQDARRYGGAAFGNISQRAPRGFLISGSQTGGLAELTRDSVCWVQACDPARNRVSACGPLRPSSEAMTHDQVYRISPRVGFVIHVHCPALWAQAATLGIPVTDAAIEYGTPAMAAAVGRLFEAARTSLPAVFSMGGHEDGVVCFGTQGASAGALLLDLLGKVREQPG